MSLTIESGRVVEIHYTLRDDTGEVMDTSDGDEALMYLHGSGHIVPGLERALEGKTVGDAVTVRVPPEDGYGVRDAERVLRVSRKDIPAGPEPEVGMELEAEGPDGDPLMLWVADIQGDEITLDGNHPLAGKTLHFEVAVHSVRDATEDEKHHGHVHGPDGHHH